MADIISLQELADAKLDAQSLEQFINGGVDEDVLTRLSQQYPTIKKLILDYQKYNGRAYKTYAEMDADKANLSSKTKVTVTNDATASNNGDWQWDGAVFTKSAFDPIKQAQEYVDQRAEQTLSQVIFEQKDVNGCSVFIIDKYGEIYSVGLDGSIQNNIKSIIQSLREIDQTITRDALNTLAADLVDINGIQLLKIDNKGNIYPTRLNGKSVQDAIIELQNNAISNKTAINVDIVGEFIIGKALYAELPQGFSASEYQWLRDDVAIPFATQSFYIPTSADLYHSLSVSAGGITGGKSVYDNSSKIGGVALEEQGVAGSIYEGFTLSAGDDFNTLDILAPHKPMGKWFTTRTYLYAPRGSDTLLGTMYDTDPHHTGHNDSNRGKPVGYNNMSVKNSVLTLTARKATAEEKKHFQGTSRNEVAAMISSVGAFSMYAGDLDAGDNILEWRVRYTVKERIPNGWHPTLWTQSSLPSVTYNSNEWDIAEGWSSGTALNYNEWVNSNSRTGASGGQNPYELYDGRWHLVTAKFNHSKVEVYFDGRLAITMNRDANNFNEPAYLLVSNHIYNGSFHGDPYSKAEWDALTKGATIEVDFVRLWRRSTKSHIKPLVAVNSVNVQSGAVGTITLPGKADLWGRTDVLEHVQSVMHEENEPAGSHSNDYNSLPSFVTYDSTTRTITINSANQKSGRLNFVIYGYLQDGSTSEPARTYVNVGPRITVDSISMAQTATYDLYQQCDCGVLVTDGIKRTKKISVSGLPTGATYNDETGLLYTNSAITGTYSILVTCINSVGQATTKTISLVIS